MSLLVETAHSARMTSLPPFRTLSSPESPNSPQLAQALATLFESSPILISTLVPQLSSLLGTSSNSSIVSYHDLIQAALDTITDWDDDLKSQFIAGHPRIGETKNLSNLSAREQGASGIDTAASAITTTPPDVLARLERLNALYERRYPGLRYITFVNGRSRAAIAEEMEVFLGIKHSEEPSYTDLAPEVVGGAAWKAELGRAIFDIGRIANSRLEALGVQ
jgi:2-oxo-4-hydroxy-4-carboxy--5-ureidoimidazoline (OHCU) decarboxylase